MLLPLQILINLRASGGGINYTLSGSAGSYTVAGQAATFKVGRLLSGSAGAYSIAGQTGTFRVGHTLTGAAGAYSIAGQVGTLAYTPGGGAVDYSLSGAAGSYTISGQSGAFNYRSNKPSAGSYRGFKRQSWMRKRKQVLAANPVAIEIVEKVAQVYSEPNRFATIGEAIARLQTELLAQNVQILEMHAELLEMELARLAEIEDEDDLLLMM